jgi:hypothetical protein
MNCAPATRGLYPGLYATLPRPPASGWQSKVRPLNFNKPNRHQLLYAGAPSICGGYADATAETGMVAYPLTECICEP